MGTFSRLVLVLLALLSFSLTPPPAPAAEWRAGTDRPPAHARGDPAHWLRYTPTYNGRRDSPRAHTNTSDIKKIGTRGGFWGGGPGADDESPRANPHTSV